MDDKTTTKEAQTTAKKKKTVSAKPVETPQASAATKQAPRRSWNVGTVFWGLLLVVFGGLLLLGNLDVVEVNWDDLWRLWPLLIVAVGFSMLAATHWVWKLVSIVFVIAAICAVVWVGTGQYETGTRESTTQSVSISAERNVTTADLTVQAGASKLMVRSDDMAKIVSASMQSEGLRLKKESRLEDTTQKVVLSSDARRNAWFSPVHNTWDITVTERLPMKLTIKAGASSVDADLAKVRLTALSVDAGASSTVITLGDKEANLTVDIDSGASSTTLRLPKDSGVAMNFEGGLSSREFDDLKETAKGEYQSDNYATATKRITINADAGLASFKVERY